MPRIVDSAQDFLIIGENIHATRVVLLKGIRVTTLEDGTEAVIFQGESGEQLSMPIPGSYKQTQPYQQGQVKHYMIAVNKGLSEDPEEQAQGRAYVNYGVRRQVNVGAHFLDLNVDEVSLQDRGPETGHGVAGQNPCRKCLPFLPAWTLRTPRLSLPDWPSTTGGRAGPC